MTQEELQAASVHFCPDMQVLVPDLGMLRRATVYQIARGVFDGVYGWGLMVWFPHSLHANVYELSWALKYVQVLPAEG